MGSLRISPSETTHHKIKNEMLGYHILHWEGPVYTHTVPNGQTVNASWYIKVLKRLITVHHNDQKKLHLDNAYPYV